MIKEKTSQKASFEIPAHFVRSGKILQFFSKDAATRYIAQMFAIPMQFKAPEREMMMRESSKKERLQVEKIKKEVQVYVYGYSRKRVMLVHGWAGRGTQLYNLADKILENKMMVVSFDAPGHGLSEGKRTNILEYIETIKAIDKAYGPFDAAIGHSFGGMSLINAVAKGMNLNRLITIGADNSIPEIYAYYVKKMQLNPEIAERLQQLFEKNHNLKIERLSSSNRAERIKIPTLVIHDSEDRIVNVRSAISIRQKLRNGELLITNGLGHHKVFKSPFVINRIINFLQ